jgi:protein-S-isoprenylcysteine O-methyltransferase Ste14
MRGAKTFDRLLFDHETTNCSDGGVGDSDVEAGFAHPVSVTIQAWVQKGREGQRGSADDTTGGYTLKRITGFLYGLIAYGIFFLTFLYLVGFLADWIVPKGIDDGGSVSTAVALLVDIGLIALFGLQHSVMARPGFKKILERIIPRSVERSTFVLIASCVLILLYWQWRPATQVIWHAEDAGLAVALWSVYAVGFAIVLLSTFVIDHFDLFGLRQVTLNLLNRRYTNPPFKVTFFYRFIRHPLYLGFLLAFWATPTMTLGHLLFAAGMTSYILIAVRYEERDLELLLGEDYRNYRARVPMLLPRPGRVHETVSARTDITGSPHTG